MTNSSMMRGRNIGTYAYRLSNSPQGNMQWVSNTLLEKYKPSYMLPEFIEFDSCVKSLDLVPARRHIESAERILDSMGKVKSMVRGKDHLDIALYLRKGFLFQQLGEFEVERKCLNTIMENYEEELGADSNVLTTSLLISGIQLGLDTCNVLDTLLFNSKTVSEEFLKNDLGALEDAEHSFKNVILSIYKARLVFKEYRDVSIEYLEKGLKISAELENEFYRFICLFEAGKTFHILGDSITSEGLFRKSIRIFESKILNQVGLGSTFALEYTHAIRLYGELLENLEWNNISRKSEAQHLWNKASSLVNKQVPHLHLYNPKYMRRISTLEFEELMN